jgi:SNF family Na+-dependent transporter
MVVKKKESWDSKLILLAAIGYAVGHGNTWFFPYLNWKCGSG